MRQAISLLLISILVFPVAPISAQDVTPNDELADRLGNMNAEAETFLGNKPELARNSIAHQNRDESDSEALRKKLLGAGSGKTLTVTLNDGTALQGRLGDVTEDFFQLLLVTDEWRQLAYDEVANVWVEPTVGAVTPDGSTWSTKKTLIVLGAIVGALLLVAIYRWGAPAPGRSKN